MHTAPASKVEGLGDLHATELRGILTSTPSRASNSKSAYR